MANILVIDDAPEIRRLIGQALEGAGYSVVEADSAHSGLTALLHEAFDAVLLDLEMPGVDGAACLSAIRACKPVSQARVLMITGTPLRDVMIRLMKLGVQGITIKEGNWIPGLLEHLAAVLADARRAPPGEGASVPAPVDELNTQVPHLEGTPAPAAGARSASSATGRPGRAPMVTEQWVVPPIAEDEVLTVEEATEKLKSFKPIIARSELLDVMLSDTVSAKAIKPAVLQVLHLTESPDSSVTAIANAIRQDQAISLRILRMANSSLYSRGDHVDTVFKAVARIGLGQIHTVVLTVAVLDSFGSAAAPGTLRQDWFWEHSTACGLLAMKLCQAARRPREEFETIFTAGLLHDLGRLLYTENLPDHYPKVIQTAAMLQLPLETVESRLLLMNHAEITEQLLRHWHFPTSLINPVMYHHETLAGIKGKAPRLIDEVVPLALADRLAHALLMGTSGNDVLMPIEEFVAQLKIEPSEFSVVCQRARQELADTRATMQMHAGSVGSSYIDSIRQKLGAARPLPLALEPATDPVSLMIGELLAGETVDAPNLLTIRVCTADQRAQAIAKVNEATARLGPFPDNAPLPPVLVVGNTRACLLPDGALPGRAVIQVLLPIGLDRLFAQMHRLLRSVRITEPQPCAA